MFDAIGKKIEFSFSYFFWGGQKKKKVFRRLLYFLKCWEL